MSLKFLLRCMMPGTPERRVLATSPFEVFKAYKEGRKYIAYKVFEVLKKSGVLDEMDGKSLLDLEYDVKLTRLVIDILSKHGYLEVRSGVVRVLRREAERPKVTSPYLLGELIPVYDDVLETLPDALRTGERRFTWLSREAKAHFMKFLDNTGYNLARAWLIHWSGFDKLPPNSLVLDVGAGMGLSTMALLRFTKARVVAIDPDPVSLDVARDYITSLGLDASRVEFIVGYGERLGDYVREPADAAFMVNVLHWCDDPVLVLRNVSEALREGGRVAMIQVTYKGYEEGHVIVYLMGSNIPPERSELMGWFSLASFDVVKTAKYPMPAYLLRKR
ncbi:MAG: hypothetical protein DRJ56_03230 [Thermoprotei archaeon]|nr:MAG: hypothetical protein DRJ56_03230 [Thermoprotei archaeon]